MDNESKGKIKPDNVIAGNINPAIEIIIALRCVFVRTETMIPSANDDNVKIVPTKNSKKIFPATGTFNTKTEINKITTIY